MQETTLEAATVLITGASAGIGAATATAYARQGANLVLAARRNAPLTAVADRLADEHTVDTLAIPTDVRNDSNVAALVDRSLDHFGRLDIVVNNAGCIRGSDVTTNVDGVFFVTRETLPALTTTNGHLVFVGSFAGKYPRPFNPVYAATKWWLRGFAHSVMAQHGDTDVAVTVINPSAVRTDFANLADRYDPGEIVEADEVAEAIVFASRYQNATLSEIDVTARHKFTEFSA